MPLGTIFLPGIVTPAALAFANLAPHVAPRPAIFRDLALYGGGTLPRPYGFGHEISALRDAAGAAGFDRFRLVGFSAGASVAAMFALSEPAQVATLTLIEPPWLGNEDRSPSETAAMERIGAALTGPPDQAMAAFNAQMLRAGAAPPPPPPPGPPPGWMASRPAGIRAIGEAFFTGDLSEAKLTGLAMPVLFVVCGDSNPDLFAAMADRAAGVIPDMTRRDFPGLSHLNPPQVAQPAEFAALLESHWATAEA